MKSHIYQYSDPEAFDSNCAICGGKNRDSVHGRSDDGRATLASDLARMMAGWDLIQASAKEQFPHADEKELYRICKDAMDHALGLKG